MCFLWQLVHTENLLATPREDYYIKFLNYYYTEFLIEDIGSVSNQNCIKDGVVLVGAYGFSWMITEEN